MSYLNLLMMVITSKNMKNIILSLLLFPLFVNAQQSFTINGDISNLKGSAKAYLVLVKNGAWQEVDSVLIDNGKFKFTGTIDQPQQAILAIKHEGSLSNQTPRDTRGFFIENSKISFAAPDSIKNASISGSLSEKESKELQNLTSPLINTIIKLNNENGKKTKDGTYLKPIEERKIASDSVQKLVEEIKSIKVKFVNSHLNSFIGLYTYHHDILDSKFDPVAVEPTFHKFSAVLKSSPLGIKTIEKLEIGKRRQTGIAATDFTQNDLSGKPFTLSSLRGKYVLVDFWASWCVPCRAENPNLVKAYQKLKDKNFEIVGVSLDQGSKDAWANAIKQDGLPWIQVSDLNGWKNQVALMYGINSVPQNLLINPQGVIIGKNLRGEQLTEKLFELIK
jgi:thiol-disulfide isomerase/thioredoxin